MHDVLGIIRSRDTRGRRWFRVRGLGRDYEALYQWLRSRPLADEWDDFPWHGFTFEDDGDADALEIAFGS
jgi:hypothetical protein